MGRKIAEVEGTGMDRLEISILNNKKLGLAIVEPTSNGEVHRRIFIQKEQFFVLLDGLKEYYREANNNQLPLWW